MISANDKYIYLTRNHYINSGQFEKDIAYMNRIFSNYKIENNEDKSEQYNIAMENLFNNIHSIQSVGKASNKNSTNVTSISKANSLIVDVEKDVQNIITYCSDGGYIDRQAQEIQSILSQMALENIDEVFTEVQQKLNTITATLRKVFIRNNVNINRAISDFAQGASNIYKHSGQNILVLLKNINAAAIQDMADLMVTLGSCYRYILLEYAKEKGIHSIRQDVQKVLSSIPFKKYIPAPLDEPTLKLQSSKFRPKLAINKNKVTLTFNNIKLRINRIIKSIVKNFNIIEERDILFDELQDKSFLYHFANLSQYQIKGSRKGGYNNDQSPIGKDIAKDTAIVLAVKKLLNDNIKMQYYYNSKEKIRSVNELYKNMKLNLSRHKPWSSPIYTWDRRFFSSKTTTPRKRIQHILADLHSQKIRIAMK